MKQLVLILMAMVSMCTAANAQQNRVKNLSTNSKTLNVEMLKNTNQRMQISRYFFCGYNTLCMPVDVSAQQLANANLKAERFVAIQQEGNDLCLYFVDCTDQGLEAGVPYLIYASKAQTFYVPGNGTVTEPRSLVMSDSEGNTVRFGSSWQSVAKDGLYGIPAQQNTTPLESILIRTEADKTFLPTRCGFSWEQQSATAKSLVIRHAMSIAEVNAICNVKAESANGEVFDLQGRKVTGAQKGIVIENGKKVRK